MSDRRPSTCGAGCRSEVYCQAGRLFDVGTGWPHELTCYVVKARRVERSEFCEVCNGSTTHAVSMGAREELLVCYGCGGGRVQPVRRVSVGRR